MSYNIKDGKLGNFKKEDLRIIKTNRALLNAILTLLGRRNFGNITVNEICEEALVSRATFYSHFNDKYDLLNAFLMKLSEDIIKLTSDWREMEVVLNRIIYDNAKVIVNIVENANNETIELLYEFMSSVINAYIKENEHSQGISDHVMFTTFCAGGIVNLLLWQIKNRSHVKAQLITPYIIAMLKYLMEWEEQQPLDNR